MISFKRVERVDIFRGSGFGIDLVGVEVSGWIWELIGAGLVFGGWIEIMKLDIWIQNYRYGLGLSLYLYKTQICFYKSFKCWRVSKYYFKINKVMKPVIQYL